MARDVAAAVPASSRRLTGRWLLAARVAWVAVTALVVVLFVISIPGAYAFSDTLCNAASCANDQIPLAAARQLHTYGLSLAFFAGYVVALKCFTFVVFLAMATVIYWRASAGRVALVAAFTFVTFAAMVAITHPAITLPALWLRPAQLTDIVGGTAFVMLLCVFPNGRFVPRWTRWLWLVNLVGYTPHLLSQQIVTNNDPLSVLTLASLLTSLVAAQIYRYRSVSTSVERQQTKWVVLGVGAGLGGNIATIILFLSVPHLASRNVLLYLTVYTAVFGTAILIPLTFGLALLRYRLWDVDALVGRVLTYGLLTGLLGALYVGMILVLQGLSGRVIHQGTDNPLALVISTLAIAALVQPVRRWLQHSIDRRFYRAKHDTAKTLASFSGALRQQTDLEQVRAQLLAVVTETMEPAHVSLWLRQPAAPRDEHGDMAKFAP
jgi:hypothetical protein